MILSPYFTSSCMTGSCSEVGPMVDTILVNWGFHIPFKETSLVEDGVAIFERVDDDDDRILCRAKDTCECWEDISFVAREKNILRVQYLVNLVVGEYVVLLLYCSGQKCRAFHQTMLDRRIHG
mmetsp:Transcript_8008/g.9229  ORF Transcript_8008/g.9229 Transcript_8008/m.9229 type:complete len:123 (+) Transcript_8008:3139-3507(+)